MRVPERRLQGVWRFWPLALASVVAAVFWHAAGTVEWGNLLYRAGAFSAAASVYRDNLEEGRAGRLVAYNLGTALLRADPNEAERYLELAVVGPESAITQRAHYNVGYHLLRATDGSTDQDTTVVLLLASIRNNRAALRLDPEDEDARWNLALAQRRYESFGSSEEGPAGRMVGEDGTPPESEEGAGVATAIGAGTDEGGAPPDPTNAEGGGVGAREALLGTGDPGPLTVSAARRLLENLTDDPALLVRGVLWSQRPDSN